MKRERKRSREIHSNGGRSPLIGMIRELRTPPAPPGFERMVYHRLGITYVPLYRKVLIMSGLSVFAGSVYFAGRWVISLFAKRLTLAAITQFLARVYSNVLETVGIVKAGYHLKEILIAFTNPWFFVGLALVSFALMLLLIAIAKNGKRKEVLVSNH